MVLPGGSSIPELLHPRRSSEPGRLQTAASTGVLGFPAQGCHTATLDKTGSSSVPACSPAPFRRLRLPRAPSHQPLTCASFGGAAGEPLRAVAGGDVGVGSHEECQAWNTAEAARGGSPSTATIAPPQRQGGDRQRALQLRPRPPFPGSISFSPGPGEGKTGPRLLPPPTNAPGGLGTEVWEPAWWILDHTARPAAPLPREDAGRDPQRDPESWSH